MSCENCSCDCCQRERVLSRLDRLVEIELNVLTTLHDILDRMPPVPSEKPVGIKVTPGEPVKRE